MAASQLGLRVPRDLSLITFGSQEAAVAFVPLTALIVPQAQVGQQGVRRLLEKIAQPQQKLPPLAVPFDFVEGATCAPPECL